MHANVLGRSFLPVLFAGILRADAGLAAVKAQENPRCTCRSGHVYEVGMVNYSRKSGRQVIVRLETKGANECQTAWIRSTEIHPQGTGHHFSLTRVAAEERNIDPCRTQPGSSFGKRETSYEFVFEADSHSIREMRPVVPQSSPISRSALDLRSNSSLLESIVPENPAAIARRVSWHDASQPFNSTSWVLARRDVKAHHVGMAAGPPGRDRVVLMSKSSNVKAGQLGQIESVQERFLVVRFYGGSRVERFGRIETALRRWYDSAGGPYEEQEDDFLTRARAKILGVPLEDVVELNDYLDMAGTETTANDKRGGGKGRAK